MEEREREREREGRANHVVWQLTEKWGMGIELKSELLS